MNKLPYYKSRKIKKHNLHISEYGGFIFSKKNIPSKNEDFTEGHFFNDKLDIQTITSSIARRNNFNWKGPHTHIISLTRRCVNACSYCSTLCKSSGKDMSLHTAKKIIDFIMDIPQEEVFIEFTGGEPVLNFSVISKIIPYAKEKAKLNGKRIFFSVVTSLSYENSKIIDFFIKNKINICSSLDGPKDIHDANRLLISGKSGFDFTVKNIKKIQAAAKMGKTSSLNLISTVTSSSIGNEKRIVDIYLGLGIERVQLGMLEPLGKAKYKKELDISPKEYLNFYRKAIEYILEINVKRGIFLYEKGMYLILYDILNGFSNPKRSLDIYHRLAYSVDGGIYPSDESRIIGENGDETFLMGNVKKDNFRNILSSQIASFSMAYNLNCFLSPLCARCPYCLWCRAPVWHNYAYGNSLWGNMVSSPKCQMMKGIFDLAFEILADRKKSKIIRSWVENVPL